jgi:hypothetical protein
LEVRDPKFIQNCLFYESDIGLKPEKVSKCKVCKKGYSPKILKTTTKGAINGAQKGVCVKE